MEYLVAAVIVGSIIAGLLWNRYDRNKEKRGRMNGMHDSPAFKPLPMTQRKTPKAREYGKGIIPRPRPNDDEQLHRFTQDESASLLSPLNPLSPLWPGHSSSSQYHQTTPDVRHEPSPSHSHHSHHDHGSSYSQPDTSSSHSHDSGSSHSHSHDTGGSGGGGGYDGGGGGGGFDSGGGGHSHH